MVSNIDSMSIDALIKEGYNVIASQEEKLKQKVVLDKKIENYEKEIEEAEKLFDTYLKASTLIGTVADDNTKATLSKITVVINKALRVLFPNEVIEVSLKQEMYRKSYPHFKVKLNLNGKERTFNQNGSGLAQIVSFLFTVSLVDARGGRKLIIIDELLNGLHPDAKYIIKGLIEALSGRFQFIIVEYGLDIAKQYKLDRESDTTVVFEYPSNTYYRDVEIEKMRKEQQV